MQQSCNYRTNVLKIAYSTKPTGDCVVPSCTLSCRRYCNQCTWYFLQHFLQSIASILSSIHWTRFWSSFFRSFHCFRLPVHIFFSEHQQKVRKKFCWFRRYNDGWQGNGLLWLVFLCILVKFIRLFDSLSNFSRAVLLLILSSVRVVQREKILIYTNFKVQLSAVKLSNF